MLISVVNCDFVFGEPVCAKAATLPNTALRRIVISSSAPISKKLTIAHCKEIFTEYVIKGRNLDEVIAEMRKMNEEILHSNNDTEKKKVGFGAIDDFEDDGE